MDTPSPNPSFWQRMRQRIGMLILIAGALLLLDQMQVMYMSAKLETAQQPGQLSAPTARLAGV